ncbi:SET domain-containing protein [Candidatus Pacearchaeota archaeon]|nr:SET domain-containing protein [Candidatus Pacearchaeota archaeon]
MLLVKTYLDKSKIQGIGLFADEFIPKGTLIWKFAPGFDFVLTKKDLDKLPEIAKVWVLHFGYYDANEGGYVICVDDARFFNHSENPNTDNPPEGWTVANKDIHKGEELTHNYFDFDPEAKLKLTKRKMPAYLIRRNN